MIIFTPSYSVISIHEIASLLTVAPNRDCAFALKLGLDHLSAHGGGRFLSAAVIGFMSAIDFMVAHDAQSGRIPAIWRA